MMSLSAYGQLSPFLDRTELVAGRRAVERPLRRSEASFASPCLSSLVYAVSGFSEPLAAPCVGLAVPDGDRSQDWPHGGRGRDSLVGQSRPDESERRAGSSQGRPKSATGRNSGNGGVDVPRLWICKIHSAVGPDRTGQCSSHRRAACT